MRTDQRKRLGDLSERICERVLIDADPDNWTGGEALPKDMTSAVRGDAAWCRKLALASVALLCRVESLLGARADAQDADYDPEADIKRAEKDAARILKRIGERATH